MKPVGLSMAGRAVDGLGWAERAYRAHLEDAELAAASAALPRTWTTLCLRQSEWIAGIRRTRAGGAPKLCGARGSTVMSCL